MIHIIFDAKVIITNHRNKYLSDEYLKAYIYIFIDIFSWI